MGIIRQLPEHIAIKIAAGEVVERPASVVKELVENALDAGASKVEVSLKDGGKTLIEIIDNGSGMDRADAVNAFLRHGTSKIHEAEDLDTVTTLGFRGEALAAIGASAEIELITTQESSSEGTRVTVTGGVVDVPKPHAPLLGTTIRVNNLFASLPARQKFLKSEATEWKSCLDVVMKQMIAHPEVGFVLKHNERTVFDVPSDQELPSRVAETWKLEQSKLVEVLAEVPHMSLNGIVAKPEVAHEGKARQFFAVNGHPINDKAIARSIRDAFGTLLPPNMYPSYALNLTIHPGMVDVNIHPRKDEVRFVNPQEIFRFVLSAVSQAIEKANLAFAHLTSSFTPPAARTEDETIERYIAQGMPEQFSPMKLPPLSSSEPRPVSGPAFAASPVRNAMFNHVPMRSVMEAQSSIDIPEPILTLDNCYLVTIHNDKLLLVDQHAAHERILYNKFWAGDETKSLTRQALLIPASLQLNEEERATFAAHREEFEGLGFSFSGNDEDEEMFLLEVPHLIKRIDPSHYFHSLLRGLKEDRPEPELKEFKHKLFATMACKAAVKAGDSISEAEKRQLIDDLMAVPNRFTCPHGRPSHIEIDASELEKLFKRTGF